MQAVFRQIVPEHAGGEMPDGIRKAVSHYLGLSAHATGEVHQHNVAVGIHMLRTSSHTTGITGRRGCPALYYNSKKTHRLTVKSTHTVRPHSVKTHTVSPVEHKHFIADRKLRAALCHHVKLLSMTRVLLEGRPVRLRLHKHHERISRAPLKPPARLWCL